MIKKGRATIPLSTKCGLVDMYMACRLKSMANVTLEFDMARLGKGITWTKFSNVIFR